MGYAGFIHRFREQRNETPPRTQTHGMENETLWDLTRTNGGFFSRADALRCGATDRQLRIALRQGNVVRLRHGMYASAEEVSPLDANARHLLLARAVVACQEGPVALTGPSAAVLARVHRLRARPRNGPSHPA